MNNNLYRLQLRHHSEIFDTRTSAIDYINDNFKYESLIAEPVICFYGDAKKPNTIIALGAGNRRISIIDTAELNEKIEVLTGEESADKESIAYLKRSIENIVEACGLTIDTDRITKQISYQPDSKDTIIADAENIADAIDLVSKYVQSNIKQVQIDYADTNSVDINITENKSLTTLSADVKISTYGSDDSVAFNDNIIGIKNDGIYATSNLEYDEVKHTLTFSSSGMLNGKFVDDAKIKVIQLGEHSSYTADNNGHTTNIVINNIKDNQFTVSADVKLSENSNNILTVQDNKLLVEGVATNIKYNTSNVASQLDLLKSELEKQQTSIEKIEDNVSIKGVPSDTTIVDVQKGINNEGFIIKSDVRLGSDKSIIKGNDGLTANIGLKVDSTNNKLIFKIGDSTTEYQLPGVNFIDKIVYNQTNKSIFITFSNGTTTTIPVEDIVSVYTFNNINTEPVELVTTQSESGINVAPRIKLHSEDNIISVKDGKLFASKQNISNEINTKVETEKNRAVEAENSLKSKLQEELDRAVTEETNIKASVDSVLNDLKTFKSETTVKHSELENDINTISSSIVTVTEDVKTCTNSISSLDEKIESNKDNITKVSDSLTSLKDNVYTKLESDSKYSTIDQLNQKANSDSVYTKSESDGRFLSLSNAISANPENVIILDTVYGGLFSSKDSANYTAVWSDGNNISVQSAITKLYNKTESNKDAILTFQTDIDSLKNSIDLVEQEQNRIRSIIGTQGDKGSVYSEITNLYNKLEDLQKKITNMQTEITTNLNSINSAIENATTRISILEGQISTIEGKITEIETKVNSATVDPDISTVLSALTGESKEIFTDGNTSISDPSKIKIDLGDYNK